MPLRFARPAIRNEQNEPEYLNFRAQDVIAISGVSVEQNIADVQTALDNLLGLIQGIEGGLMYQGRFQPGVTTIPAPAAGNRGWFWIASHAGTWTPPGGTSTVFNVGDWLISSGTQYDHISAAQINVLQTVLTGFAANNAAIVATDTLLVAINKAQGQINNRAPLNTTLTNAAAANTLPATTSTALTALLQTVRNCLRWLTERFNASGHANRAVTADTLTTPRAINGVNFDGSAPITIAVGENNPALINQANAEAGTGNTAAGWSAQRVRQAVQAGAVPFGESTTPAGTAAKVADVAQFTRVTGRLVYINFTIANTAGTPTLNINGTGAAGIFLGAATIGTGLVAGGYLLRFNGTNYEVLNMLPSNANPAMNGAVAQGTSPRYSRQDHVHPVDTGRAAASHNHHADNINNGVLHADRMGLNNNNAAALAAAAGPGVSAVPARQDHIHPFPSAGNVGAAPANATLTNAAAANTLPAVTSSTLAALLQTTRNCLRWLVERFNASGHANRAVTADTFTTARTINGVSFNGGADITIPTGERPRLTTEGAANAYTLTPSPAITAYAAGQRWVVQFHTENTSATVNINISGLGNRRIYTRGTTNPWVREIQTGSIWLLEDNGTALIMVGAWGRAVVTQAVAEAGTNTEPQVYTPQRVRQAANAAVAAGQLHAAFATSETEMAGMNLRDNAIVFIEVTNTSISSASYAPMHVEEVYYEPVEGNETEKEGEGIE